MNTDLIIIGSGPGGYRAAEYAAQNGMNVVIAERADLGGTCLNKGCIPTKAYARNAGIIDTLRNSEAFGVGGASLDFSFARAAERKDSIVATLRSGVESLLSVPGITLIRGEAHFKDARTVEINGEEHTAPAIIIATGSEPKTLHIEGIGDSTMVWTSDQMLAATALPRRICIVGAGVVGMEFACILSSFGCEVTVVEYLKECLPMLDGDVAKRLRKAVERRGVKFFMQSAVEAVRGGSVIFSRKGKQEAVEADRVLTAVGRTPATQGLNLEAAGVEYSPKGITTDGNLQTNVPGIYAIGDVNARQMLAHAATMQGIHAVNHILGRADSIRLDIMPSAIFTHPEAACVGLTEDACKAQGLACRTARANYRANGKALAMGEAEGMVKMLADERGRIIGCHAYGAHSADIIQEVSALMCRDTTAAQLADITHIHPTLSEMVQECAAALAAG